jgi:hypothetical protein
VVDKAVVRIRNRNDGGGESAIERLQRRQQLRPRQTPSTRFTLILRKPMAAGPHSCHRFVAG